jgi:serine/threonine protein kinase/tetratricopeptide (TPR) repeat protein
MNPECQTRIKEIFSDAAELSPLVRAAYLERTCAGEPELRSEVDKLLAAFDADEGTDGILGSSSIGEFLFGHVEEPFTFCAGDCIRDRFRIVRLLGAGGMGEVYEAEDLHLGGHIAVKTLRSRFLAHPEFAARFRREIQLARRVTHPNVCRIFDIGREHTQNRDAVFLTMELLNGETLSERLKRGPFNPRDALPIVRQIAEGLAALHDAQVIHRDLKPSNVLLIDSPEGPRAVITDFGLAHAAMPASADDSLTMAGQVLGTPAYAAPEQLTNKKTGPESDLYSLGIVMYEMLTGRKPFEGDTVFESAAQKLAKPPRPPSACVPLDFRWNALILSCLEREVERRPRTAKQILRTLQQIEEACNADTAAPAKWNLRKVAILYRRPTARGPGRFHLKPYLWGLASIALTASPLLFPGVRTPAYRRMCQEFPGNAMFCELPAEKDMAVFPFTVSATAEPDKAFAAGFARHIREAYQRLAPNPDKMCVHLRIDHVSEGVRLVVEGDVQVSRQTVTLRMRIRENKPSNGSSQPLTLRRVERTWDRSAPELYVRPLLDLARALELQYPDREWRAWSQMAPKYPDSVAGYFTGLGLIEGGQYEAAVRAFDTVIDPTRDFGFAPAQVGLGDAYRLLLNKTGDHRWESLARRIYQRAASLDGVFGFAGAEKSWGDLEAGVGASASAIQHYESALQLWPYDQTLRKTLAAAYDSAQRSNEAAAILLDGTRVAPMCWLAHNSLAAFYSRHGRFREAEKSLLNVIRLASDNGGAYHNLAFDYVKSGRFDDAIQMASKSLEVRAYPMAYTTLGRAYLYRGCANDAIVNLRKGVELDPNYYMFADSLAEGLSASGDKAEAAAAAERTVGLCRLALNKAPADAPVSATCGLNLGRLGRKEQALECLRRAISDAPENDRVLLMAAETLEIIGRRGEAMQIVERAFRSGLTPAELESKPDFSALRRDTAYRALLQRLNLKPAVDLGGVSLVYASGCPEWGVAGKGLRVK